MRWHLEDHKYVSRKVADGSCIWPRAVNGEQIGILVIGTKAEAKGEMAQTSFVLVV